MMARWWVYQRERFPLALHGPLIAAFSISAVCYSSLLRGVSSLPGPRTALVAFLSALLFFLQLRISDEFKDAQDDARFRPYRPVPRGLVTLRELGVVGVGAAVIQLLLALWLDLSLVPLLLVVWVWLALMGNEFFVREWLRRRPITYMWTHMLILPLIDLYATSCDWLVAGSWPPRGLPWFLIASFFNGLVIEIGRKIRAPEDEEHGVDTYSALWGPGRAAVAWLGCLGATAGLALVAAGQIAFVPAVATVSVLLVAAATWLTVSFRHRPSRNAARWFEPTSGLWTVALYLSLGVVPMLLSR